LGDRANPSRIIFTAGRRLIGLNASTGKMDPGFDKEGEVDMTVPYSSVPTIFKNIVMVGANPGGQPTGPPEDGLHSLKPVSAPARYVLFNGERNYIRNNAIHFQ
jgi:hypothetical protein